MLEKLSKIIQSVLGGVAAVFAAIYQNNSCWSYYTYPFGFFHVRAKDKIAKKEASLLIFITIVLKR